MVSNVRGTFRDFSFDVDFDPEHAEEGRVQAVVQAASIDTGAAARDAHLRSADFLDAERSPTLTFRSTTVEPRSADGYRLHGELTIRGETRPVVLEAEYLGVAHNLQGGTSAGFSAHARISRKEWGLTWNMGLEAGGLVVSDEIRVVGLVDLRPAGRGGRLRIRGRLRPLRSHPARAVHSGSLAARPHERSESASSAIGRTRRVAVPSDCEFVVRGPERRPVRPPSPVEPVAPRPEC
jgi:polyisoprenoid-binding protein YceI